MGDVLRAYYGSEGFPVSPTGPDVGATRVAQAFGEPRPKTWADYLADIQRADEAYGGSNAALVAGARDLAHQVGGMISGEMPYHPGLRREDVTDIPAPGGVLGPREYQPNDPYIQRSTDLAAATMGGPAWVTDKTIGEALRSGLPSFYERMEGLKDVAFQRAQRGQPTGDYGLGTARRTAPDAPAGSFDRLAAETRAGFKGDQERVIDEYRRAT